jgi:hypothetical protein
MEKKWTSEVARQSLGFRAGRCAGAILYPTERFELASGASNDHGRTLEQLASRCMTHGAKVTPLLLREQGTFIGTR